MQGYACDKMDINWMAAPNWMPNYFLAPFIEMLRWSTMYNNHHVLFIASLSPDHEARRLKNSVKGGTYTAILHHVSPGIFEGIWRMQITLKTPWP